MYRRGHHKNHRQMKKFSLGFLTNDMVFRKISIAYNHFDWQKQPGSSSHNVKLCHESNYLMQLAGHFAFPEGL